MCLFIRGFTSAAFMDSGNTPENNEVFTIFAIGQISTSWHSLTNHFGVCWQKAFEDLFSSCLIQLTERRSKVSIMEMDDPSTDEISVGGPVDGDPLCIVIIFSWKKFLKSCAVFFGTFNICWHNCLISVQNLVTHAKTVFWSLGCL